MMIIGLIVLACCVSVAQAFVVDNNIYLTK